MVKFYIFRHGATFASKFAGGVYEGDNFNTPILEEGKGVIKKLAQYLKDIPSDFNVSSPYLRCKQTAAIITEITGKEFILDERLGELFQIDVYDYRKGIEDFLREIKEKNYQNIIICTHGATMSYLIHLICEEHPEENIPYSEYADTGKLVVIEDKKINMIDFNLQ